MVRKPARAVKIRLASCSRPDTIRYMEAGIRLPAVAGSFYPGDHDALAAAASKLLGDEIDRRCAALASPFGLIVPHAGYSYSGPTAAAGFRAVAAQGRPSVIVLLGASHSGLGGPVTLSNQKAWQTPLGDVPVAADIVERLRSGGMPVDESAFGREHSIEVQLPFLQILWGSAVPVVPICVQTTALEVLCAAGEAIARALDDRPSALIVASSDFTHYEPDETARRIDQAALDPILALEAPRFFRLCVEQHLSICGAGAIVVLMSAARCLGLEETNLVDYSTSGDTTGDRSAVVGYAAVSFVRRNNG